VFFCAPCNVWIGSCISNINCSAPEFSTVFFIVVLLLLFCCCPSAKQPSPLFCSVIGSLHNGRAAHVHRSVTSYYYDAYVCHFLMLEITCSQVHCGFVCLSVRVHVHCIVKLNLLNPLSPRWLLYIPPVLALNNFTFCPHTVLRVSYKSQSTALQVGRSRVRFPRVSLECFIDIILPVALWPWGWLSL